VEQKTDSNNLISVKAIPGSHLHQKMSNMVKVPHPVLARSYLFNNRENNQFAHQDKGSLPGLLQS
jgi:hypothetical protein